MESTESPVWVHEESEALAKGTRKPTSATPTEPIKTARLFSLANSHKSPAATARSTQLDLITSPFHLSQNLNTSNAFFESDSLSQIIRSEVHEEKNSTDPYYSPPSTFMPPESPDDMRVEGQVSLVTLSSEAKVREGCLVNHIQH